MDLVHFFDSTACPVFLLDEQFIVVQKNPVAAPLPLRPDAFAARLTDRERDLLRQGMPMRMPWYDRLQEFTALQLLPMAGGYAALLQQAAISADGRLSALEKTMQDLQGLVAALPAIGFFAGDSSENMQVVDYATRQVYRALRDVNDQIWGLRLAGSAPLDCRPLDLNEELSVLCHTINAALPAVQIEYKGPVCSVPIFASKDLLELIFTHLIHNSVTYAREESSIQVQLQQTDRKAILHVTDTGKGMQPCVAQQVFDPYFSCDPYCDGDARPGSGLGLYLVWQGVRAMGGAVALESEYGSGTHITLSLPLADRASLMEVHSGMMDYLMDRMSILYMQFVPLGGKMR